MDPKELEAGDGNSIGNSNGNQDERDAMGNTKFMQESSAIMPVSRCSRYYNMNHKYRGTALIFNHEHFLVEGLKSRTGTTVDCLAIQQSLTKLGFMVQVFNDLKYDKLFEKVSDAARADHSENDCFVMCVLSHGEQNILYCHDNGYKPERLWSQFTADVCPTLAGKPKLFFIQACQGDRLDSGVILSRSETDGLPSHSYKIPSQADFLIAYSTVPGFYSWRNTTRGSWFIQALCQELELYGHDHDILTLLTFTSQRVALDYESNTPDTPHMHAQKQIPCITSMLIRLVTFPKKGSNENLTTEEKAPKQKPKRTLSSFFSTSKSHSYEVNQVI